MGLQLSEKNPANSRGHEPNHGVTSHIQVVTMGFDTKTFGWYPHSWMVPNPQSWVPYLDDTPMAGCFIMDNLDNPNLKWMVSGYPHFTKPLSVYVCQVRWHCQAQKNQSAVGFLELVRTLIRVIFSPNTFETMVWVGDFHIIWTIEWGCLIFRGWDYHFYSFYVSSFMILGSIFGNSTHSHGTSPFLVLVGKSSINQHSLWITILSRAIFYSKRLVYWRVPRYRCRGGGFSVIFHISDFHQRWYRSLTHDWIHWHHVTEYIDMLMNMYIYIYHQLNKNMNACHQ